MRCWCGRERGRYCIENHGVPVEPVTALDWIALGFALALVGLIGLFLVSCASVETLPRRACLYDDSTHWRSGTVTEKRDDGARLFRFDDHREGDHGFKWVESDDRRLGPCRASDMDKFSAEHP